MRHERIERLLNFFTKSAKHLALSLDRTPPDLLIIVRTSGRLAQVMEDYEKITSPHLFVDIAYDHTLSLGPLVFVGETACLGCFLGRVTRNWGDAEPPEISNVSERVELIASLIFEQILTFQRIGSCPELLEKTWTFNLADMTTKSDAVFRLPWCPNCYPDAPQEGLGSFELPWRLRSSQTE